MKNTLLIILILSPLGLWAQKEITVNGMKLSYQIISDQIEISLTAPTTGWVGIGFNQENSIVKSDLLLFHVVQKKTDVLDMYVLGFGNPKKDLTIGGTNDVEMLEGYEQNGKTFIKFRLKMNSGDKYDFAHQPGKKFWLIMAYSTHDDFNHHSRMRKHVPFSFTQ